MGRKTLDKSPLADYVCWDYFKLTERRERNKKDVH